MSEDIKFVWMMSTGGAVMNAVLGCPYVRDLTHSVVADKKCGALDKAGSLGIPTKLFEESDPEIFCDHVLKYMEENNVSHVIASYTKFFSEKFRDVMRDKIINPHPSLLPAFKGLDAFNDGYNYGAQILGSTIEFPRDVMDEGVILSQTCCVVDRNEDMSVTRHKIFLQQCKSIIQMVKWVVDGRVHIDENDNVEIIDAQYDSNEYSPSLDFDLAIDFTVPYPNSF